jgi:exopolysaccharide production protein ExoY
VTSGQLPALHPFDAPVARFDERPKNGFHPYTEAELCALLGLQEWRGKRAMDVGLAMVLAIVLAPVALLAAFAIWLESPRSPVLFKQRRVGRYGREFSMLKFRTMQPDAEDQLRSNGELLERFTTSDHKIPNSLDPRITWTGRFLRRSSIDEIPQLLNVLTGDMSLVGPRPVERTQLDQYGQLRPYYLAMRPGLTGMWQVKGRSRIKFPVRASVDEDYAKRCSFLLDLAILLRTPFAVIRGLNED